MAKATVLFILTNVASADAAGSNQACNVGSLADRIDCGTPFEKDCEERGCCFNRIWPNPNNYSWCFHEKGRCDVAPEKRQDVLAINPADPDGWAHQASYSRVDCGKLGNCWVETDVPNPASPDGRPYPWCFYEPGRCDARAELRRDCGYTGINATDCNERGCCWAPTWPNPDNVPYCFYMMGFFKSTGTWVLKYDAAAGAITQSIAMGVTTTDTVGVTTSLTMGFSDAIEGGCEFLGLGGKDTLTISASLSVSQSVTEALAQSKVTTVSVNCPAQAGKHTWLYQWQVAAFHDPTPEDDSKADISAFTQHYRCHYTDGPEEAPQCPYQFCGENNPNCQRDRCAPYTNVAVGATFV